jgi:ATP/maltotriose-dependent transcriptional regulator MalT
MGDRPGPGLVGREDSLALLAAALQRAATGTPGLVVVAGETGVGKTALVQEFLATAGASVLAGVCVPVAGEPLPYAALTQALRRARGHGVVRQEVGRSPELARLLPGAPPDPEVAEPTAASRVRLFQAVLGLLERMGAGGPVVHVVEDVHWADPATLDLLAFLATNLTDERVLLLMTYRTEEVADTDALATWLAELGRLRSAEVLRLGRLDRGQASELVARLLGAEPDPDLLAATLERSAGNPLFVEQLVLSGDGPGALPGTLPGTLRDLLRARVGRLPEGTRGVLRAASVVGRVASVPLLARTGGADVATVEELLRPALAARVLEVRGDDRIGFQHPAFQEVVYAELLPAERARLHRAAAEALAEQPEPSAEVVGEVARHWHRAGDLARALDAAVRAGEASEGIYAFADARASYTRALELLDQVPSAYDRVQLAARAAECAHLVGDTEAALRLAGSALAQVSDPADRARLHERLGSYHFLAGDGPAAERSFREALALLPPGDTSVLAARAQAGLGLYYAAWSRFDEADVACAEALRIAAEVGAPREEGVARNALGVVAAGRGNPDEALRQLRASLGTALELEQPGDVASAYVNLSHVLGLAGRLDEVVSLARDGLAQLTRYGQDRQNGSLLLVNASIALVGSGRLAEAEEVIATALRRQPRGIMAAPVFLMAARIRLAEGDLDVARDHADQARLVIEAEDAPVAWLREAVETGAEVELWAGRPVAALAAVTDGLEVIAGTDEERFATGLLALGLRALADDAAVRRDPASRAERRSRREELLGTLARTRAGIGDQALPETAVLDQVCDAELARLDEAAAAPLWANVAGAWRDLGRPFPAAYAGWREAEELLRDGVSAPATAALRRVHAASRELGARRLVEEVEALARWYRLDLLPVVPAQRREEPAAEALAAYGLTARELEVLTALAEGHSNKEIAEEMFISVKTASVHVSNILRKLDVGGRQDAARIAHRLGIGG